MIIQTKISQKKNNNKTLTVNCKNNHLCFVLVKIKNKFKKIIITVYISKQFCFFQEHYYSYYYIVFFEQLITRQTLDDMTKLQKRNRWQCTFRILSAIVIVDWNQIVKYNFKKMLFQWLCNPNKTFSCGKGRTNITVNFTSNDSLDVLSPKPMFYVCLIFPMADTIQVTDKY